VSLRAEILEQPAVLERLLGRETASARAIARAVRARGVGWVFLAARGSSDHAGLYAQYLWGAHNRLAVALATPSLFTLYRTPPRLAGALVVGISQSGRSPDIVGVLAEARRQGAPTLAITNDPSSPLALQADLLLDTGTGPERAVAATKTYTAQLLAIAMLSAALDPDAERERALERLPDAVRAALALDEEIAAAAPAYRDLDHCAVIGRGFNYASAYEWALKLKEMAAVAAEPSSSADFRHGPIAMVAPGATLLAVAPGGAAFDDVAGLLAELAVERGVRVVAISDQDRVLALARTPLRLPAGLPESLSPIVAIVPAQLFALHLAVARGRDPEAPRGLEKVTETW
jgi:glucosamine--fructose-6-phosphate aminotransferase (isomerizing)